MRFWLGILVRSNLRTGAGGYFLPLVATGPIGMYIRHFTVESEKCSKFEHVRQPIWELITRQKVRLLNSTGLILLVTITIWMSVFMPIRRLPLLGRLLLEQQFFIVSSSRPAFRCYRLNANNDYCGLGWNYFYIIRIINTLDYIKRLSLDEIKKKHKSKVL